MNRLFIRQWLLVPLLALTFVFQVQSKGLELELYEVNLPRALTLIYSQIFQRPFMLHPDLHHDTRTLTLYLTPEVDPEQFIRRYLANMNIAIHRRDGVDYIAPEVKRIKPIKMGSFVYEPRHRSVSYLADLLRSQFPGQLSASSGVGSSAQLQPGEVEPGTASAMLNRAGDVLVYYGPAQDIARLKAMLPMIDTQVGEVLVKGYVFEVQTTERNGSGLAVAAKLLSGRFGIEIGTAQGMGNMVTFNTPSLDAIYEMFSTDGRFHVLSAPMLRVKSGARASFSVGSEVPVLGSVIIQDQTPVQSVEYRSSGVLFEVLPQIRREVIDLDISQQLSNFVKTDTGVNNSPTLIKRDVSTSVTVGDGDIILLSGLAENKDSDANTGLSFLPNFMRSNANENSKTDIIVIMQANRIIR
ncbi:type II secretion system protein GspD [Oceanisphaera sp. W20_SRM_FM3]|uniref:type II secretion system protein GspD n=1 Tax=Oceanisphaera sp. W20_SRM_FM3 TaxID=3240267 RepID=UPI003F9C1CA1